MFRTKRVVWCGALILLYVIVASTVYFIVSSNYDVYRNPRNSLPLGSAEVVGYTSVVPQGGTIHAHRRIIDEPDGCSIHVRRYLSPTNNSNLAFLVAEEIRQSFPNKDNKKVQDFTTHVPDTFPVGNYVYFAKLEYYCTWVQKIFGPGTFTNQPVLVRIVPAGQDPKEYVKEEAIKNDKSPENVPT